MLNTTNWNVKGFENMMKDSIIVKAFLNVVTGIIYYISDINWKILS